MIFLFMQLKFESKIVSIFNRKDIFVKCLPKMRAKFAITLIVRC